MTIHFLNRQFLKTPLSGQQFGFTVRPLIKNPWLQNKIVIPTGARRAQWRDLLFSHSVSDPNESIAVLHQRFLRYTGQALLTIANVRPS